LIVTSGTGVITGRQIRFLADENLRAAIVDGLRRRQPMIDIVTAVKAGLLHRADPDVLSFAMEQGRVLLTHDARTIPDHLGALLLTLTPEQHSPGVFVLPQRLATGPAIEEILLLWEASEPEEWRNRVTYLPL
jgi:hypothetical protein